VLLEAAASGVPIVATNVGGTREILVDDRSARLVPAGDARVLAAAIAELHDDPEKRRRFGDAARLSTQLNFEIKHAAWNLVPVWRALIPDSDID
jgi:glycosyltransferase involved in cell wall biosynthesis